MLSAGAMFHEHREGAGWGGRRLSELGCCGWVRWVGHLVRFGSIEVVGGLRRGHRVVDLGWKLATCEGQADPWP